MADRHPEEPEDSEDPGLVGPGCAPGTPRWVKLFGLLALALVVLLVVALIVVGGDHGPGRHSGRGVPPPAGVADDSGHVSPLGAGQGGRQP